jgi:ABC-type glycerol-3-phosphate transport system substrate-binding protein
MKFKILAGFSLSAVLLIGACGGNKDNTNVNANANRNATVSTPTPVAKTSETAATDPAMKSKIEDALKKKGFNDVTVDTSTTPMTLRGSVAKGKLAEVMATAMEANGGKPVTNQVSEK